MLRELPELQAGAKGANAAALATKLRQHYTDSVDILTLTPDLEVLGHLHNMSLFHPYYLHRSERIPQYFRVVKVICRGWKLRHKAEAKNPTRQTLKNLSPIWKRGFSNTQIMKVFSISTAYLFVLYIKAGRENEIDQLIERFKIVNSKTLIAQIYEELGNTELAIEYLSKIKPPLTLLGKSVPDFSETDLNGKPISLQHYRGKVVLLDFWAVWNGFCIGDILNVKKIYDTYKDQGFEVIGVSLDTDEKQLRNYLKENDIQWRQIFSGQERQCPLVQQYDVRSIPTRWLVDREGRLIAHEANHKLISREGREPDLEGLVAEAVLSKSKNP